MPLPIVRAGRLRADIEALLSLAHLHDPEQCSAAGCCCSSYEVCVTRHEMSRISGLIPAASRYAPWLGGPEGLDNPFERAEPGLYALDTTEDGACVFAYQDAAGYVRCAVHTAALDLGLNPYKSKPRSCTLWPLALSSDRPPVLTVQDDAFDFPCNRKRPLQPELDPGVAEIIESVFGKKQFSELSAAIAAVFEDVRPAHRHNPAPGEVR